MHWKKIAIISIFIVVGAGLWVTMFEVQKHWNPNSFLITITCDEDFLSLGLEGEGTESKPFLIKNEVIQTDKSGIKITNTTKFCLIQYCSIISGGIAILILKAAPSTIQIIDNEVSTNLRGIEVKETNLVEISNNQCEKNHEVGIELISSDYSIIQNNTCTQNGVGIRLTSSSNNLITDNLLRENEEYGISIENSMLVYSENNFIYNNHFIDNYEDKRSKSQAFDEGLTNYWYNQVTNIGNYYSDFTAGEYEIDGYADSVDPYPQTEFPEEVKGEGFLVLTLSLILLSLRRMKLFCPLYKRNFS